MVYSCIKDLHLPLSLVVPRELHTGARACNAARRHSSAVWYGFNAPHRPRRGRARRRRWVASRRRRWGQPCARPCQLTLGAACLPLAPPPAYCSLQRAQHRSPACARSAAPCRVRRPSSALCCSLAPQRWCSSAAAVNALVASLRVCGGLQSELWYLIGSDQNIALNRLQKCGQNVANLQIANRFWI